MKKVALILAIVLLGASKKQEHVLGTTPDCVRVKAFAKGSECTHIDGNLYDCTHVLVEVSCVKSITPPEK